MANEFAARTSVEQVEEGAELAPKFDADGLIPAVTTAAQTGELLMVGYMNAEALRKTIETGEAHYWSRSRQVLWHKGATSGLVQKVVELMIDVDFEPDAVLVVVDHELDDFLYEAARRALVPEHLTAAAPVVRLAGLDRLT